MNRTTIPMETMHVPIRILKNRYKQGRGEYTRNHAEETPWQDKT